MALSAKEKLFNMIITRYTDSRSGFTAQDCADFTQVNRSVVSHYLNRLCEDGCLTKENTGQFVFLWFMKIVLSLLFHCHSEETGRFQPVNWLSW
jgi:transcriptional regulator with AAA-type ATPase domain